MEQLSTPELKEVILERLEGKDWVTTTEITKLCGQSVANILDTFSRQKKSPVTKKKKGGK